MTQVVCVECATTLKVWTALVTTAQTWNSKPEWFCCRNCRNTAFDLAKCKACKTTCKFRRYNTEGCLYYDRTRDFSTAVCDKCIAAGAKYVYDYVREMKK
jgi:hypothetical protein